ncbi:glutathione S-transferase family protein [Sphingomonas immobilis]|uniref:Glutathione S-transferase family protein n=1 Tax=Sphingomonas immobilis TaxID=3063997 RepID=A0ABT8ZYJ3_9SPHN|nr:glutathione S-transferase family protein [Sphingomonas sp. CA1-15]MDO7842075.1 glutathione S-transferase family protein [Sphingomonas sp. CA1-15]
MLTLHHLGISQSDRVVWLCEELGIAYDLVRYDRDPQSRMAPAAYRALHPFGTAPVISDGDLVLGETGAIFDYIIAVYGGGRLKLEPAAPGYADFLFWYHFANGSFMPAIMVDMIVSRVAPDPKAVAALTARSTRAWEMVETRLGAAAWFAGDAFTAADVMMVFPLTTMRAFLPKDLTTFPNVRAYLQRVGARPAYRAAMEKADPGVPLRLD